MTDVTQILYQIESGDPTAAEQLLPLVYDELRSLAAHRLRHEQPGQTLQTTALVHEAYVRLVDQDDAAQWNGRGHFFAAAAEAMRRILVEKARHKARLKRGGDCNRVDLESFHEYSEDRNDETLAVDDLLDVLAQENDRAAQLVKLRYFVGMTLPEAAAALAISPRSADRLWAYAKAWLYEALRS